MIAALARRGRIPCRLVFSRAMIILLSPAKTIDESGVDSKIISSEPRQTEEKDVLLKTCRQLTQSQIKGLMSVSDAIAKLNHTRFQSFETLSAKQAALAFDGPAYKGLAAIDFSDTQMQFAQENL